MYGKLPCTGICVVAEARVYVLKKTDVQRRTRKHVRARTTRNLSRNATEVYPPLIASVELLLVLLYNGPMQPRSVHPFLLVHKEPVACSVFAFVGRYAPEERKRSDPWRVGRFAEEVVVQAEVAEQAGSVEDSGVVVVEADSAEMVAEAVDLEAETAAVADSGGGDGGCGGPNTSAVMTTLSISRSRVIAPPGSFVVEKHRR
jgi:hypothetical protein